jgi:hemerythrin superfamily protein
MDPTKLLEADHRMVESLFERIPKAGENERQPLVAELATALGAHMELEESIVYPGIEGLVGTRTIQEGITEHNLARTVMNKVLALAPAEPGFEGALEALKAAIEHHVEEEEGEVFPKVRKDGRDLLDQLEQPVLVKRQQLGLPADAASVAGASTKDELLAEARSLDLTGASSMTKEQLAEALMANLG